MAVLLNGHTLDIEHAELRDAQGRRVELRPQALAVLLELARRPGEVVTKRDLLAKVWPGVAVTDDSLVQCIVEVRRALGDSRQHTVRTMPRRGYLLICDAADGPRDGATPRNVRRIAAAVASIAAAVVIAWQFAAPRIDHMQRDAGAAREAAVINVAVLPLRVLDAHADATAPDGDGLAYMIAGELARNRDLRVMSTLVTAELRREGKSARQIGASTGARYVVDGSVERRGDRLGLALQLVDVNDDRIMWSGRVEPTAQELPGTTQALIERLSGSLGATVRELHLSASLQRAPASLDAHARALRGIALLRNASRESLLQARHELEQATRLDPRYAPAWAHLGAVKVVLIYSRNDPTLGPTDMPQAIADIRHAVALDPTLADAWRRLSYAIDSSQHAEEAVRAAERAVELGPGDPENWLALGLAQHHAGRTEAGLPHVEKALSWSPLRPAEYALVESRLRYTLQDHERALHRARECMDRAPAYVVCKALWLSSLLRTGLTAEAEAAWPALLAAAPSLQSYRMSPRGTPAARAVDEDLDRLRGSATATVR